MPMDKQIKFFYITTIIKVLNIAIIAIALLLLYYFKYI